MSEEQTWVFNANHLIKPNDMHLEKRLNEPSNDHESRRELRAIKRPWLDALI